MKGVVAWVCAVVAIGVLTGFAALLITGRYLADGPVLLSVTENHGLHEGDVFVGAGWLLAVVAVVVLTVRRGR